MRRMSLSSNFPVSATSGATGESATAPPPIFLILGVVPRRVNGSKGEPGINIVLHPEYANQSTCTIGRLGCRGGVLLVIGLFRLDIAIVTGIGPVVAQEETINCLPGLTFFVEVLWQLQVER